MIRSLWVAKTGMEGQQTKLDAIANNLANVATTGFKRGGVLFEDLMYQNLRPAGAATSEQSQLPTGLQIGLGTRVAAATRSFSQGTLQQSSNTLDVAIKGHGFLQVTLPDGTTGYTRDGALQVDSAGQLVNAAGYAVQPGITIPANAQAVSIADNGTVNVTLPGQAAPQAVGQIQLATFVNPAGLDPRGQNLFAETAASGTPQAGGQLQLASFINPGGPDPRGQNLYAETAASGAPSTGAPGADGRGGLMQGFVEGSNVNVVEELVAMIATQRAYELNSKAIQTSDQMLQRLGQL